MTPQALLLASLLEQGLRQYLRRDPLSAERLAPLQGRILQVSLSDLEQTFYLLGSSDRLLVTLHEPGNPDASVRGRCLDLLRLGRQNAAGEGEVRLSGRMEVAQAFGELLKQNQIDWEAELARLTGGWLARKILWQGRQLNDWLVDSTQTAGLNLREYLQDEVSLLAPGAARDDWQAQLSRLRSDTARLEARFKRLQRQVS